MATPRRGETLIDFLMTMSGVVGAIAVGVFLKRMTPLPFWACILIALPTGMIAGWAVFFGLITGLEKVLSIFQKK